ncbi:Gfo/Idh/MocA family oxidoreductase [Paenibacillus rhizovicinus]|uniref:Gfo/Idh/MocA family oxidoreductase n=1 Tax=Paenibacillus rhizovicinus TaxID=2704463 RepID=A0A6C0PCK7_9BACL|nr:Gfo/Idh/MocA family oxidoreductase [Paenibacillus rhizovicinus]QHW34772.1 Gfo/Idh/MocA family oxidoreductase [Paenibacillus rhizovicinus]
MRIGLAGCGWHSRATHGPCLKRYRETHADLVLAACCDVNTEAAEAFRADFGFSRAYSSFQEMLENERLDAVWIVVSVEYTASLALQAMDAGIPVFLEKPPGIDSAETQLLQERAAKLGIPHRVAFNRRFAPLTRKLIARLNAAPSRRIYNIAYEMIRIDRTDADFSTTAVHAIDAARFIAGSDYAELQFRYEELEDVGPGVANIIADGLFENGVRVQLLCYPYSGVAMEKVTVRGEGFSCEMQLPLLEGVGQTASMKYAEKGRGEVYQAEGDWLEAFGFYDENASFIDALREGWPLRDDLRSSRQSIDVMEAIRGRAIAYRK